MCDIIYEGNEKDDDERVVIEVANEELESNLKNKRSLMQNGS